MQDKEKPPANKNDRDMCGRGFQPGRFQVVVDNIRPPALVGLAGCRTTVASYPTTAITPPEGQSAPHQRPRLEWLERLGNKNRELEFRNNNE